jgi:hypothetical protein
MLSWHWEVRQQQQQQQQLCWSKNSLLEQQQ